MSAAKSTAAHWGAWRRSAVTLLAVCAGASVVLGGSAGGVFAADPSPTQSPAPSQHPKKGNPGSHGTGTPAAAASPSPSPSPAPSPSPPQDAPKQPGSKPAPKAS